jgi:hypothetical protein
VLRPDTTTLSDERLHQACRQTAAWIERQLGDGGHSIVRTPLVLAGDLTDEQLQQWWRETVAPAARAMADRYFSVPPSEPVTILLLSTEESYRRHAKTIFGDENVSRFGYYRPHLRTVVVNAAAGHGAVLHELTHALAAFDFPDMPAWLGEGLASLHEDGRLREDGSDIDGQVNWRLPMLQQAIHEHRLRPVESLVRGDDFRTADQRLHYAQARYLCLYLQRRGVLAEVYRRIRADRRVDPMGGRAVLRACGNCTWDELDAAFRGFVMGLRNGP